MCFQILAIEINDKNLKIFFLLILKTKWILLLNKYAKVILLDLWAKYEPIWPVFTVQAVIFVLVFLSE